MKAVFRPAGRAALNTATPPPAVTSRPLAAAARLDETAVTAGETANRSRIQSFDELRFTYTRIERLRQWHIGGGDLMIEKRRDAARSHRTLPGVSSYRRRTVRTSRSDSSRTLAVGNMMSVESFE